MAENAFLGLENTLRELNLKDNMFHSFPMSAVKILKKLQSLNLANNRISNITAEPFTRLETIRHGPHSQNTLTNFSMYLQLGPFARTCNPSKWEVDI